MLSVLLENVSFSHNFTEFAVFFTVLATFVFHCFVYTVGLTLCSSIL